MNIEEFKLLTKEELIEYGKTIPLEADYDSMGNRLNYKTIDGYWYQKIYDSSRNILMYMNSTGYWTESTYNANNNQLTYKHSRGYSSEATYDDNNNELTYKDSGGYWTEATYDDNNNELTYKDSEGCDFELLCAGKEYNLMYDKSTQVYRAGCQQLNYNECIELYNKTGKNYMDAKLFMDAIHQNEK